MSPKRSSDSGEWLARSSEESSRGAADRASTALSRPPSSAQMTCPSVFTLSGSSTPASCTLVCDVSSPAPASASAVGASRISQGSGERGGTSFGACAFA